MKSPKKNKTYIELANERHEANKQTKADKIALERDKFEWNKKKDIKNGIISVLIGIPVGIIVITFTIIWVKLLVS